MALSSAANFATPVPLTMLIVPTMGSDASDAGDAIFGYPRCAVSCVERFCTPSNTTCTCGSDKGSIDRCVFGSCAVPEAIFTRNFTEITCKTVVRNRAVRFNIMIISMTAVVLPIVVARLIYKQFFSARRRLNSEDWTTVAAVMLGIPSVFLTIFGLTAHGMGIDLWGLSQRDLVAFGRFFYAIQVIYILLMLLLKLTLTFFYLNIFTGRTIRILLQVTLAFHVLGAIAFTIGLIFQCLPISYQWDKYNYIDGNPVKGRCINVNAGAWANSAISVASDIWLLALPLSQIHKLQLHWKKKLGAALMFLTGAIVTVVSLLRLASIRNYASTSNPTWDQWDIVWWSTIEIEVGFVCTCLPTMRLILVRMAPRVFGSDSVDSSITLHRIESKSTRHTRPEEEEELTLQTIVPKRSSAPAVSSAEYSIKKPNPTQYSWQIVSSTSQPRAATGRYETWQGDGAFHGTKQPTNWRGSI